MICVLPDPSGSSTGGHEYSIVNSSTDIEKSKGTWLVLFNYLNLYYKNVTSVERLIKFLFQRKFENRLRISIFLKTEAALKSED